MHRLILCLSLLAFSCCNTATHNLRHNTPAFYHWKTNFSPSVYEMKTLDSLKVKKLYVKYFDVAWDEKAGEPRPLATLYVSDKNCLQQFDIVPTVYITNECIFKIKPEQTDSLAQRMHRLLVSLNANNNLRTPKEIQIDCDWTKSTKEKYFAILTKLQALDPAQNYSVTIRLHQVKYMNSTGVPPVKNGMLMCYNMGNLRDVNTRNSILEIVELKKYLANLSRYPLHLDVAFPIFDWVVLLRDRKFTGLLQNLGADFFDHNIFTQDGNIYTVTKDTTLEGYILKQGDVLRLEQSKIADITEAAKLVSQDLRDSSVTVSLFHLDSMALKKYTVSQLSGIFKAMD